MRVIAGEFGGRPIVAPRGRHTRPTSDRVREALFMALGPLEGLKIVDLYSGSGSLGIEALSRGAAFAHFVDADRQARECIQANLAKLGIESRARIWGLPLPRGLKQIAGPLREAGLVLLDPPYGGDEAAAALAGLGRPGVLESGTRVVLERHAKDVVPETAGGLVRSQERRYGETVVDVYEARTSAPPGEDLG